MKTEITEGIKNHKEFSELRELIVRFKDQGGKQREALQILEEIRQEFKDDEEKEDLVLELLDYVAGWCQPQYRIWEDQLIFIKSDHDITGRSLIIEEDENSIWAYLTLPNEMDIDKDCFLASRHKITEKIDNMDYWRSRQMPPPMTQEYSTNHGSFQQIEEKDINIRWIDQGNVIIELKGTPFLFFHHDFRKGFCKSIKKDGGYGKEWDEEIYRKML